jgi:hypothetical protein
MQFFQRRRSLLQGTIFAKLNIKLLHQTLSYAAVKSITTSAVFNYFLKPLSEKVV